MPGVQRPPWLAQQRAIGRILNKRVLEQISRMRRRRLGEKQTSTERAGQAPRPAPSRSGRATAARRRMGKLPPDAPRRSAPPPWPLPSRSSRAISEACKLAGTASAGEGRATRAFRRALALRLQHRLRHLLDEQRNAVRALDDVLSDVGGQRPIAGDLSIKAVTSRGASRLIVSAVTCGRPIQGAANSGRKVTNSRTRKSSILSTSRPSTSRLDGSAQWASSKIIRTGDLARDRPRPGRSTPP